jgi:hypothetical protein
MQDDGDHVPVRLRGRAGPREPCSISTITRAPLGRVSRTSRRRLMRTTMSPPTTLSCRPVSAGTSRASTSMASISTGPARPPRSTSASTRTAKESARRNRSRPSRQAIYRNGRRLRDHSHADGESRAGDPLGIGAGKPEPHACCAVALDRPYGDVQRRCRLAPPRERLWHRLHGLRAPNRLPPHRA